MNAEEKLFLITLVTDKVVLINETTVDDHKEEAITFKTPVKVEKDVLTDEKAGGRY